MVGARRDAAAFVLLLLFGGLAVHQGLSALHPPAADLGADAATAQAGALLLLGLAGLGALAVVARLARERDRAEELHWDAMETLRAVNELRLPGGSADAERPEHGLDALLRLGTERFGLPIGVVQRHGSDDPVALRLPAELDIESSQVVAALARFDGRQAERPLVEDTDDEATLGRIFIASLHRDGEAVGRIAFAAASRPRAKLTATDKDLLALLATAAADRLGLPGRAAGAEPPPRLAAAAPAEVTPPSEPLPAPSFAERLRERLADDPIVLAVDPRLDDAEGADLGLEEVAVGLARGARRASAEGSLRVESGSIHSPQGDARFVTLTVHIDDPELDASALDGVSSTDDGSLGALGERLRSQGGDVSMSVEAGVGATMTAFVPLPPAAGRSAPHPLAHLVT